MVKWTVRLLERLREFVGRPALTVRVRCCACRWTDAGIACLTHEALDCIDYLQDFYTNLPNHTKMYFRWKQNRKAANVKEDGADATAEAASSGDDAESEREEDGEGDGADGEAALTGEAAGDTAEVVDVSSCWMRFLERMRFANVRTIPMSTLEYEEFARYAWPRPLHLWPS